MTQNQKIVVGALAVVGTVHTYKIAKKKTNQFLINHGIQKIK